jgi:hypothetical protein
MDRVSLYFGKFMNSFIDFGSYLFNLSTNFFYRKWIKSFTTEPGKSILEKEINSKYIKLTILNLKINKNLPKYINYIIIPKCIIYFFPFKQDPFILYKLKNIEISINNNIRNINEFKNILDRRNNILENIHNIIEESYQIIDNISSIFVSKQKILLENTNINFNKFTISIKNSYINKIGNNITSKCKIIKINHNKINFITIKSIKNIIKQKIECYISNILVKITKHLDTTSLISFLNNLDIGSSRNNIKFFLAINKITIKLINDNYLHLIINDLQSDFTKFIGSDTIKIKCFKKNILFVDKQIFYFDSYQLEFDHFNMNIFESTGHKLYLSLNKYIKKIKIKSPEKINKTFDLNINNNYISNLNSNFEVIDTKPSISSYLSDNLNKSFIVTSNNITKSTFIKKNTNKQIRFTFFIRKSKIIFSNVEKNFTSEFINENILIKMISKNNYIITNTNLIINYNNKCVLKKIPTNRKIYLNMIYTSGKLVVRLGYTYFNIITIFFKHLSDIIHKNTVSIMKLFYYNYTKNSVIENFFINYFKLDPIMMKVFYYPKNCNYYNLFLGDFGEVYRVINYKDVNINTKCVIIHYPYNMSMIFKKIFKIWINDIYTNQKENILKGTTLDKMVKNPKNYLRSFFSSVEKLISISSDLVNK